MARPPRFALADFPQHVIQRGNNRCPIFFDTTDYRYYLDCLRHAIERYACHVHAYVLMTNHVHVLVTPRHEQSLAKTMHNIGLRYTRYVNQRYRRSGTLWEGRYKASLIESDRYLTACMRYIEQNPVRAGMVSNPADYPWSSHPCNGQGESDPVVTPHPIYHSLGRDPAARLNAYRGLFESLVDEDTLRRLRHSTNSGWVLGDDPFLGDVEQALQRRPRPSPRGGDRRSECYRKTETNRN